MALLKMRESKAFQRMEKILKLERDQDTRLKLAYLAYPNSDFIFEQGEGKDVTTAEVKKIAGNFCFQNKTKKEAIMHYNVGIVKCPQDTAAERELLSTLVANRSAVFFEMKEYEKVLKDISFIDKLGSCPAHLDYKLACRKAKCYEALNQFEKADEAFDESLKLLRENCGFTETERSRKIGIIEQLKKNKRAMERNKPEIKTLEDVETFEGGEKYISASPLIDIKYDEENGRHAVAVEDIPVGTLIVKEESYVSVVLECKSTTNCQHCFAAVDQPIPCPKCANVVFCSTACMDIALASYHRLECPIYGSLYECGPIGTIVMRIFTQSGFSFFYDQKSKLMELLEDESVLGLPEKDVYRHDDHDNIMKLFWREGFDVFVHCSTAFIMHALKMIKFFPFETSNDTISLDEELFIAKLILRHCRMVNFNVHGLGEINALDHRVMLRNGLDSFFEMVRIGIGLFPTFAFFNHSCEPSVIRTSLNRKMLVRTIKPIRAGDIIYDNYGSHFLWTPWQERQNYLQTNYKFKCTCTPCQEKWPCVEQLETIVNVPCRNRNCDYINALTTAQLHQKRCSLCHRRFHPDAITCITVPTYKQIEKAENLYKDRKYAKAGKVYIKVLKHLFRYTNKPDMLIIKVQDNVDVCMSHFGNKSSIYLEKYFSS